MAEERPPFPRPPPFATGFRFSARCCQVAPDGAAVKALREWTLHGEERARARGAALTRQAPSCLHCWSLSTAREHGMSTAHSRATALSPRPEPVSEAESRSAEAGRPVCTHTCSTLGPHPAGHLRPSSACRLHAEASPRFLPVEMLPTPAFWPLAGCSPTNSPGQPRQCTRALPLSLPETPTPAQGPGLPPAAARPSCPCPSPRKRH